MTALHFADAEARADFATYVSRARALDPDGAMRLQATGMALAAYVGVLPGSGLMSEGSVIGLRVMPLAEAASLDSTVALGSLTDRLARGGGIDRPDSLEVPPTTVHVGWAALAPPRSGWEPAGTVASSLLDDVARQGIAEVAEGSSPTSGGHAVTALRAAVWGRPVDALTAHGVRLSAGGAFAAYVLGFLTSGAEVGIFRQGRWLRLSTPAGHVLVR